RIAIPATLVVAALLVWITPAIPWGVIAYGRQFREKLAEKNVLLSVEEGMNSSIAVLGLDGIRTFHVSGKVEASSGPNDMRLQRMLGDLPALIHPNPRSVLVVGCGAGVTAGSFTQHP